MELQPPTEVPVPGQLFELSLSMKVLAVVITGLADVIVTVTVTEVELTGTVNRYHTSALLPQPVDTLVVFALYK